MKRLLLCLPLLGLAPLAHFLGFYLSGLGVIDSGLGLNIGTFGVLLLIVIVGLPFGYLAPSTSNFVAYFAWVGAVAVQFGLLATLPGGAEAEVMGVAHRLKKEFPIGQVRDCASQLLEKYQAEALASTEPAIDVNISELPAALQGRFRWVQVRKVERGYLKDVQVFFFIDWAQSIICDSRPYVSDAYLHSIEKGVHAYHVGRS